MLNWFLSTSVLIAVILLLRRLLRDRLDPRLTYALWLLAALRILIPVSLFSLPVSVASLTEQSGISESAEQVREVLSPKSVMTTSIPADSDLTMEEVAESWTDRGLQVYEVRPYTEEELTEIRRETPGFYQNTDSLPLRMTVETLIGRLPFWNWVYLAGCFVTLIALGRIDRSFHKRVKKYRKPYEGELPVECPVPVYVMSSLPSPCLYLMNRPAIYLNDGAVKSDHLDHILTHEIVHYRHRDHWWAMVRCLCLVVQWFNPLVWLAAYLSRQDCELACDASVIKRLGEEQRLSYGKTLVDMIAAARHPGALLQTATTMTGGKKSITQRIQLIVKRPKMTAATLIAVLLIAAGTAACAFGGAKKEPADTDPQMGSAEHEGTELTTVSPITAQERLAGEPFAGILSVAPRWSAYVTRTDGALYSANRGDTSHLGRTDTGDNDFHKVADFTPKYLYTGQWVAYAIDQDDTLWGWGGSSSEPRTLLSDVQMVTENGVFALALRTDDTLWTWDTSTFNPEAPQEAPTQIMSGVADISCHTGRHLVLKLDGTLWTVTQGSTGPMAEQLMDNVKSLRGFMAITADGALWSFAAGGGVELSLGSDTVLDTGSGQGYDLLIDGNGILWGLDDVGQPARLAENCAQIVSGSTRVIWIDNAGQLMALNADGSAVVLADQVLYASSGVDNVLMYLRADGSLWNIQCENFDQWPFAGTPEQLLTGVFEPKSTTSNSSNSLSAADLAESVYQSIVGDYDSRDCYMVIYDDTVGSVTRIHMTGENSWNLPDNVSAFDWAYASPDGADANFGVTLTSADGETWLRCWEGTDRVRLHTDGQDYFLTATVPEGRSSAPLFDALLRAADDALVHEAYDIVIDGSVTDYETVVEEYAQQFAARLNNLPLWASSRPENAVYRTSGVSQAYFGEGTENFCASFGLYFSPEMGMSDWQAGSGMDEETEGEYAGWWKWGIGADFARNADGDWYCTGTYTGGVGLTYPTPLGEATPEELVYYFCHTTGTDHSYRIPLELLNRSVDELTALNGILSGISEQEGKELCSALGQLLYEYDYGEIRYSHLTALLEEPYRTWLDEGISPQVTRFTDYGRRVMDSELVLQNGVQLRMSYDQVAALTGYIQAAPSTGSASFTVDGVMYLFTRSGNGSLILTSISVSDRAVNTSVFRNIRLGDSIESVFSKLPAQDTELKKWAIQVLYGSGAYDEVGYAELEYVAGSYYCIKILTPDGITVISFSRNDLRVNMIEIYDRETFG